MIDQLALLIEKYWTTYGRAEQYDRNALSFTKFCQRVAQPHTKVLYFVTFRGMPLCILKTVRSPQYNENLRREASHQAAAPRTPVLSAPHVFWVDDAEGRAVYAEEYIDALPVRLSDYRALGTAIAAFSVSFPVTGTMRSDEFVARIESYLPDDPVIKRHLETLKTLKVPVALGPTHGDMGRQNILGTRDRAWVIDWERAGDVPIHRFDVVDVELKLDSLAVPSDRALFAVRSIYTALYRRFPEAYRRIALSTRDMVGSTQV